MHKNDDVLTMLGMVDDSIEYSAVFKQDSLGLSMEAQGGVAALSKSPSWSDGAEFDCGVLPTSGDQ